MRYLLITHNANNLGDVAIAQATMQHIRLIDKDAEILLESNNPSLSIKYFPDIVVFSRYFSTKGIRVGSKLLSVSFFKNNFGVLTVTVAKVVWLVLISRLRLKVAYPKLLKEAGKADVILSIAGDSISERYAYQLRFIEINSIVKINSNLVMYAQSIGPFSSHRSQLMARKSLSKVRLILARDRKTQQLLKEYAVQAPIEITADTVISLEPNTSKKAFKTVDDFAISNKTVIIVVRSKLLSAISFAEYESYLSNTKEMVLELTKNNTHIVFAGTIPEDCSAGQALCEDINVKNIRMLKLYDLLPSEAKVVLSRAGLVISPRMHPIILATSAGAPALAITQEFKLKSYMQNIGLADQTIEMDNFNADVAIKKINSILNNREKYLAKMTQPMKHLKKLSLNNSKYLSKIVCAKKH